MSNSNWYFAIQREVSALMNVTLSEVLEAADGRVCDVIAPLIKRKIEKRTNMRPLLFFIGYCIGKNKVISLDELSDAERHVVSRITAALELENVSSYYINHYLDGKGDIKNEQDAKNRVLAGLLCRDLAHSVIVSSDFLSDEQKKIITDTLVAIDFDINCAQVADINGLLFENIEKFQDREVYERAYFERCKLISGQFYGRCVELGMKIGGADSMAKDLCESFTALYTKMSTLGQFGNDIGDFAPPEMHTGTVEKNYYKDYGSDFINGRLTLPNYLLLTRADKNDLDQLNNIRQEGFLAENMKIILSLLKKYGVIDDCIRLLKDQFTQEKKLFRYESSELRTLISSSLIIFKSNKLIISVREAVAG